MTLVGPLARDILQPAACFDIYATVGQAASALREGRGCFVRQNVSCWSVHPSALAGIPSSRRLIDVPLTEVEPFDLLATVSEAAFAVAGHRPVFDANGLCCGQITRLGLARHQGAVSDLVDLRASLASIAHDFNNVLLVTQAAAAESDEGRLSAGIGELARLVQRLGALEHRTSEDRRVFALQPFLEGSAAELSSVTGTPIELGLVRGATDCRPGTLRRILLNLCMNAADAGARCIRWSVEGSEAGPILLVEDDGPGFPPAIVDRVFDRGFSTTGGSGLGLPTVRRLAEAMGASVEIRSGTAGGCVAIALPMVREPPPPEPST